MSKGEGLERAIANDKTTQQDSRRGFSSPFGPGVRSVLKQLVLEVLALKQEQAVVELKQNAEALLEQMPQDQIDADVEDILRRSEEEGGAA